MLQLLTVVVSITATVFTMRQILVDVCINVVQLRIPDIRTTQRSRNRGTDIS